MKYLEKQTGLGNRRQSNQEASHATCTKGGTRENGIGTLPRLPSQGLALLVLVPLGHSGVTSNALKIGWLGGPGRLQVELSLKMMVPCHSTAQIDPRGLILPPTASKQPAKPQQLP